MFLQSRPELLGGLSLGCFSSLCKNPSFLWGHVLGHQSWIDGCLLGAVPGGHGESSSKLCNFDRIVGDGVAGSMIA